MKRILPLLLSLLALTAAAQSFTAADDDPGFGSSQAPTQRYRVATGSFWSNWYVQAHLAASSFYGDRANTAARLPGGLTRGFRTRMGLSLALGKWFTPGLGLRTRLDGLWGRTVTSTSAACNASRYWALSQQALFNVSNLFCGYSDTRRWNLIPYAGTALGRSTTHNTYALGLALGVLNQWRLTPRLSLGLDVAWNIFEPDFDGAGGALAGHGLRTKDQVASVQLGITWHLGSPGFRPLPDTEALNTLTQSQIEALNAQLADEQAENARLRAIIGAAGQDKAR